MLKAFLLTLSLSLLPAISVSVLFRKTRSAFLSLPMGVVFQCGFLAVLSALVHSLPFGVTKTVLVTAAATVLTGLTLGCFKPRFRSSLARVWDARTLVGLGFLALILIADNFYIVGHQGWEFQTGGLWTLSTSYFRGPFNTDAERNVILVNALIRGSHSPFLPQQHFAYQLLPFHFMALVASHFNAPTLYPFVSGITVGIAALFVFVLLNSLLIFRPVFIKRPFLLLAFVFIIFSHSDLIHMLLSLIKFHRLGIEADGSFSWLFFRNFSLKLTSLLSPHHLFSFLFLNLFMVTERIVYRAQRGLFRSVCFLLAFLSSPIFAVLFFPFYLLAQLLKEGTKTRERGRLIGGAFGVLLLGVFFHRLLLGFSVMDLFFRQVKGDLSFLSIPIWKREGWFAFLSMPLLWVNCLGALGILVSVGLIHRRKNFTVSNLYLGVLLCGNLAVYYVLRGAELQRHFTILSCLIGVFFVASEWKLKKSLTQWARLGLGMVFLMSFLAHSYFIFCFTKKPNIVEANVAWQDYFGMNEVLRTRFSQMPTLAAISFRNGGFPLIMEATTSFSTPMDAFIYHRLDAETVDTLYRSWAALQITPYGEKLGYRAILWGPIEEKVWGPQIKERFIVEENRMYTVGKVALFRLEDGLLNRFKASTPFVNESVEYYDALGRLWFDKGWFQESYDAFKLVLEKDPKRPMVQYLVGRLFLEGNRPQEALKFFLKAAELVPENPEVHQGLGTAWQGMGESGKAQGAFARARDLREPTGNEVSLPLEK